MLLHRPKPPLKQSPSSPRAVWWMENEGIIPPGLWTIRLILTGEEGKMEKETSWEGITRVVFTLKRSEQLNQRTFRQTEICFCTRFQIGVSILSAQQSKAIIKWEQSQDWSMLSSHCVKVKFTFCWCVLLSLQLHDAWLLSLKSPTDFLKNSLNFWHNDAKVRLPKFSKVCFTNYKGFKQC